MYVCTYVFISRMLWFFSYSGFHRILRKLELLGNKNKKKILTKIQNKMKCSVKRLKG